nr:hypothetical protein Iba_chr02aCG9940 [Ipomoea batatas]
MKSYARETKRYLQVCNLQALCFLKWFCQNLKQLLMLKGQSICNPFHHRCHQQAYLWFYYLHADSAPVSHQNSCTLLIVFLNPNMYHRQHLFH